MLRSSTTLDAQAALNIRSGYALRDVARYQQQNPQQENIMTSTEAKILAFLKNHPGSDQRSIREYCHIGNKHVLDLLAGLLAQREIQIELGTHNTRKYFLRPKPQNSGHVAGHIYMRQYKWTAATL